MKIAWFTPFSRSSAIGKYSALALEELGRTHEVVVFAPDLASTSEGWPSGARVERIGGKGGHPDLVRTLPGFDAVVYNLGNCLRFHLDIYRTSRVYPGVIILHDLSLHEFFQGLYLGIEQDGEEWVRQMAFAHGSAGGAIARKIVAGTIPPIGSEPAALTYHMARSAVHGSLGVVVHGQWVHQQLAGVASMPVRHIDFPAAEMSRRRFSARRGGDKLRLLTFGMVNPNKMSDRVIEVIAASPLLRRRVSYTIAGACPQTDYRVRLMELIRRHGLDGIVRWVDWQPDESLYRLINEADVLVNLRNPHFGECSWSLLEGLSLAKPTVVWKHGYYDEFPTEVVKKVCSLEEARLALEEFCDNPELCHRLGRQAQSYVTERFNTSAFVARLVAFVEECRLRRPIYELVDEVSRHVQELVGEMPCDDLVSLVSDEIGQFSGDF